MSKNRWFVYMHVNKINGKRYVGITGVDPEKRWGINGARYIHKRPNGQWSHPAFGPAVEKYGWDGFDHLIILSNVDEAEAKYAERYLIKWYQTNDGKHGYNCTGGGDGRYIHGLGYDVEHKKEKEREWHQKNIEKRHAQAHANYEKNKDHIIEKQKQYQKDNHDKYIERHHKYYESHKQQAHEYYERNKERILEKKREREQKKLEKLKEDTNNER